MRGVLLGMLKTSSTVLPEIEVVRYVAERERISRAVALVQRGDFQAARIQLDIAYRLHPQDVDAVVNCYPLLREAGQLELAQELFKQYEAALLQQLKAWPNDAMALNNLAWMYAKSDEKLDQAYQLSRQAVMLVPNSAVYLDTLAEVQFHRGDIEEALATMRNCVRLDPRAPNYRKNLVRFSSARH
jgi:tetratricopeptide (TPR) repeat protein